MKIGVIGSSLCPDGSALEKAKRVGEEIAIHGCDLLTGACFGIPYESVIGAKEKGGFVAGISPAINLKEHVKEYKYPAKNFDILIFTGTGKKGRNVTFIQSCDAVILIAGRMGTLNEFTIAYDEGKVIGVLKGTGGISEIIPDIIAKCGKEGGTVIYDEGPRSLVERVINEIEATEKMTDVK